jgi:outer membrane immunogenic protein
MKQGASMFKKMVLTAAMVLAGSAANAADMPLKAAPPAYAPVVNWTGFYLGGEAGYVWGQTDRVTTLIPTTISTNPDGFVAAVFGGYDIQLPNNFVIGARIAAPVFSSAKDTTVDPLFPALISYEGKFLWAVLGTAQFGYAIGAWQPYVGVGVAFGEGRATMNNAFFAPGPTTFSDEQTHVGLVLNAGVKYMFARNWFAGVHYTHIEWQDKTYSFTTPGAAFATSIGASTDSVVATLGYKF